MGYAVSGARFHTFDVTFEGQNVTATFCSGENRAWRSAEGQPGCLRDRPIMVSKTASSLPSVHSLTSYWVAVTMRNNCAELQNLSFCLYSPGNVEVKGKVGAFNKQHICGNLDILGMEFRNSCVIFPKISWISVTRIML